MYLLDRDIPIDPSGGSSHSFSAIFLLIFRLISAVNSRPDLYFRSASEVKSSPWLPPGLPYQPPPTQDDEDFFKGESENSSEATRYENE